MAAEADEWLASTGTPWTSKDVGCKGRTESARKACCKAGAVAGSKRCDSAEGAHGLRP